MTSNFSLFSTRSSRNAAGQALFLDRPEDREQARQMVIAVSRVRNELQAAADLPEDGRTADVLARSME